MFGGTAATKSTLVKRGPKEQSENVNGGEPPAKRVKTEGGASDLDDEIRRNFEKGTVAKASLRLSLFSNDVTLSYYVTNGGSDTAYNACVERVLGFPWSSCGWKEGRFGGPG